MNDKPVTTYDQMREALTRANELTEQVAVTSEALDVLTDEVQTLRAELRRLVHKRDETKKHRTKLMVQERAAWRKFEAIKRALRNDAGTSWAK